MTAFVSVVNPPLPAFFGNTVLATPLTSIPAVSPMAPFNISNPSCLIPSLLKFLVLRIMFPAFNTVLNPTLPLVTSPNTSDTPAAIPP